MKKKNLPLPKKYQYVVVDITGRLVVFCDTLSEAEGACYSSDRIFQYERAYMARGQKEKKS